MDNEEDRQSLLVQGINLHGRQIPLHLQECLISYGYRQRKENLSVNNNYIILDL
jgi:hypothetical protein